MNNLAKLITLFTLLGMTYGQPELILINSTGLHPEGLEYSTATGFLVSSAGKGTVYKLHDDGNLQEFVTDPDLKDTLGLQIDQPRNRLLIVNTNGAAFEGTVTGFLAGLVIADLASGEVQLKVDLSDIGGDVSHFANDLAVDADGNVYVTDSLTPQIWKVTPTGEPSVFLTSPEFAPITGGIGLNGIDYHPNGYLIASHAAGKLIKIPVNNPQGLETVQVNQPIPGLDGIIFRPGGAKLIAVGEQKKIWEISSEDNWVTATVIGEGISKYGQPSTVTLRDGIVYATRAYFGADPAIYEIERIDMGENVTEPSTTVGTTESASTSPSNTTQGSTGTVVGTTGQQTQATTGATTSPETNNTLPQTTHQTTDSNADNQGTGLSISIAAVVSAAILAAIH